MGPYNVILISLDTLRADRVGCYGYSRAVSPTLDGLASRGARFAHAVAEVSWTLPSHMTIFTGLLPSRHHVTLPEHILSPQIKTMAEIFRKNGYRTYGNTEGLFLSGYYGFQRGFDTYDDQRKPFNETISQAKAWLQKRPKGKPFFMFLHTYEIHCPYDPPEKYNTMFPQRPPQDWIETKGRCGNPEYNQMDLTPGQVSFISDKYDMEIRFSDDCLKQFITFLEAQDVFKDTILVVLSDHGEEFREHGQIGHERTLYIESLIVPLIIVAPTLKPVVIQEMVGLANVMPTILDMIGLTCPPVQGKSLLPLMQGIDPPRTDNMVFSELDHQVHLRSAMKGANHLILNLDRNKKALYDIQKDPQEQINIFGSRPEIENQLETALNNYLIATEIRRPVEKIAITPEQQKAFRSLGYLN